MISGRLWLELGTAMRRVRSDAGVSLRELERRGSWRRSTISQVETAKAHPSRELVSWFDSELGANGWLVSIYAEARSRQLLARDGNGASAGVGDDAVRVIATDPPAGSSVERDARVGCRVRLANTGATAWTGRALRRMGAFDGGRLLSSVEQVSVPDTEAGGVAELTVELHTPDHAGVVVAFWSLVDATGHECAPTSPPVQVLLTVR